MRLVTRNTIEEQIHALGEAKLALDDKVAGVVADDVVDKKADVKAEKQGVKEVEEMMLGKINAELKETKEVKPAQTNDVEHPDINM